MCRGAGDHYRAQLGESNADARRFFLNRVITPKRRRSGRRNSRLLSGYRRELRRCWPHRCSDRLRLAEPVRPQAGAARELRHRQLGTDRRSAFFVPPCMLLGVFNVGASGVVRFGAGSMLGDQRLQGVGRSGVRRGKYPSRRASMTSSEPSRVHTITRRRRAWSGPVFVAAAVVVRGLRRSPRSFRVPSSGAAVFLILASSSASPESKSSRLS